MRAKMYNFSCWTTKTNSVELCRHFAKLLNKSGFSVLDVTEHHFTPQGYTALFLLSESHFAIHTFPERGKTYIELTSCVEKPFKNFIDMFDMETTEPDI